MKTTKLDKSLARIVARSGALISFVYFELDGGQVLEREAGDPYELSIFLVYSPGDDPDGAEEAADAAAREVEDAFEAKLTEIGVISLKSCLCISEDDLPVSQARLLMQWRLEHMTLKAEEEQPGPIAI
jgi:hypothetical protein